MKTEVGPEAQDGIERGPDLIPDPSRRTLLRAAGLLTAGFLLPQTRAAAAHQIEPGFDHHVLVVIVGGTRRAESFSPHGVENIPHLSADLLPKALFYAHARNEGVTAHYNAIASILTGNWQRLDDWGKLAPATPTLFEQFRKDRRAGSNDAWMIASNKALTSEIGASSDRHYGPDYGANVVFPKQLMLAAISAALRNRRTENMTDRNKVEAELESAMEGSNYEGLGWNVFDAADRLDPRVRSSIQDALAAFVHGSGPTSGDELTFYVSREVMRRFAPRLLVVALSDVEAAHFGSYAMHVGGVRTADRICYQFWQEIEANPAYHGKTTMIVLPEFGRDPDGSSTNGFFNHRANDDSTRDTWMMALGEAVQAPAFIDRPIRHIDLCPTLATLLGCHPLNAQGQLLDELRG